MPITYIDKDKTAAVGQPERAWRDVDANEVKTVVNAVETDATQALIDAAAAQGTADSAAAALDLKADSTITMVSVTGGVTLDATAFGKLHVLSGTSADYTVVLPTAVGNTGLSISFKGGNTAAFSKQATIDGNAAETIDGIITRLIAAGGAFTLISDGANWMVYDEIPSWIQYDSGTSAWSSVTNNEVYYSLHGKQLTISIWISGTGTGTSVTLNLPPNLNYVTQYTPVIRITNTTNFAGTVSILPNTSSFGAFTNVAGAAWTNGALRTVNFTLTGRIA